jgi:Ras-related protein Rab-1A
MSKQEAAGQQDGAAKQDEQSKKKVSIIIIGDAAVGKTSILNWYDTRKFNKQHIRTVGLDSVRTEHKTRDGEAKLDVKLWDTAGQDRFKNMTY